MATNFEPYDDEKLMGYLLKYVCGIPIQCNQIRFVNLYGNKKPSELFDTTTDHVNYFFTQLKKKTGKGKNFNRAIVGGGSWKGLDKSKSVSDKKGSVIGFKKTFRFVDDDDHHHVWIMKEYHLNDKILQALRHRRQIRHEDFVMCRITRNVNSVKLSSNSKVSLLTTESNVVPVTQLPMISTEECSVPMVYALDEETACVSASDYDIASYHEGIDAYAAAMLELNPLFVPYVPQDEDQCPLFSEDFYIGHTALWG
ncbi:hypothetical protein K7X08_022224 [Anisodus acutangulus]|uniref:NAC domain-containing protein n=1 Tax=Anisodus acutangulus TaxID=402998 RepID=A0A9Q1L787_9SOLA|nr:hypothetical protein K7X08_022224 [Anisodus acutangulus]